MSRLTIVQGVQYSSEEQKNLAWGIKDCTFEPGPYISQVATTSQQVQGGMVWLRAGVTYTGIVVTVGTTGTPTSCWGVLYSTAGVRLGVSADTPSWVTTSGLRNVAFTSAYVSTVDQAAYACILHNGSTGSQITRGTNAFTDAFVAGPNSGVLRYVQQTGQASPPSPATLVKSATAIWIGVY